MDRTRNRTRRVGLLAACAAAIGIGAAQPAHASNDFANGFEDQLGRLFAFEAFRLGQGILAHALAGPPVAIGYGDPYYDDAPVVYPRHRPVARRGHRAVRRPHPRYHAYDCDHPDHRRYERWDDYAYDDRYYDD